MGLIQTTCIPFKDFKTNKSNNISDNIYDDSGMYAPKTTKLQCIFDIKHHIDGNTLIGSYL